jgi:predicted HAD superfamily Cof-like phosphohydrolase
MKNRTKSRPDKLTAESARPFRNYGVGVLAQMLSASAEGSTQQRELQHELHAHFGQAIDRVEQFLHHEH